MKVKLALLVGGAVGYVLGTRDGRQRYEQIRAKADELWHDPVVRAKVGHVTDHAMDAASQVSHKAEQATGLNPGSDSTATAGADHRGEDRHG